MSLEGITYANKSLILKIKPLPLREENTVFILSYTLFTQI